MPSINIPEKSVEKFPGSNNLLLTVNGKNIVIVPKPLIAVFEAIDKSRYILDLKENWDGEGTPGYSFNVWEKAILFITRLAIKIYKTCNQIIKAPKIYHGPNGSVDIYWENESFNLLINIPQDGAGYILRG